MFILLCYKYIYWQSFWVFLPQTAPSFLPNIFYLKVKRPYKRFLSITPLLGSKCHRWCKKISSHRPCALIEGFDMPHRGRHVGMLGIIITFQIATSSLLIKHVLRCPFGPFVYGFLDVCKL